MTVKEMIEKLQRMNPEAVVVDDNFGITSEDGDEKWYLDIVGISEIKESDDKKYVRLW